MAALVLPDEPELVFRQLHHDLHAFASHTMDDDDALAFMTRLLGHESDFLAPVALPPAQASERQALQREGSVTVAGKRVQVSQRIQQEILQMSDEFKVSEARCLELWFLASDAAKREWIERVDQLPQNAIAGSIPAAARHFLVSEVESKLNLLKELMRLRFDDRLDKRRRQFVLSYTNKLLSEQLLIKLLDACESQLPKLMEITPLQQAVSYWHDLVAGCVLFIVSSVHVLPAEIEKLVSVMKALCARLNTVVAKVSPHIVNLTSFSQLFESGSLAGTSPEGVVKQVSCMLRAMTTIQVALLVVFLDQRADRIDRETGDVVAEHPLSAASQASTVRTLHRVIFDEQWEQSTFQGVSMLGWAGFLAHQVGDESAAIHNSSSVAAASGNVFAEVEAVPRVVKAALEKQVFTTLSSLLLKYLPDAKHDPLLYRIFERQLESLLINYSSRLMVDVPTVADQAAIAQMQAESDGEIASWEGDCLENIVEFAIALCQRDPQFPRKFWPSEELHSEKLHSDDASDSDNCHDFLIACRDVAQKNPSCLASYLQLVAAAADGVDCAQLAFHHIKQNPAVLSWDHFFAVMNKYQRLLTEAERPANASGSNGFAMLGASAASNGSNPADGRSGVAGPRFIRPKELEALEAIQSVMQAVVQDQQLALIFFHNHDWSPIQTFVSFLQCRVPSSLKGELMKTLSFFAQVPEVAPFVWRQMDALQILRTTPDAAVYGLEDISYELEHYESMNRRYPATRGFLLLLNELFDNPHAWGSFEGDGRIAAIQFYFDHVLEKVFLKFDLRKYEFDAEKWTLVHSVLAIFKKILHQRHGSASLAEGSLAFQLLQRLLSGSAVLDKLFYILSTDGGVDSLESTATNVHLEHAFFFCLEHAKRQTELTHGAMQFSSDNGSSASSGSRANRRKQPFARDAAWQPQVGVASPRERCVRYALELLVLVLEKDTQFVNAEATRRSLGGRAQVEMLHSILFRHRADFVNVVQYVKYTKSAYIPRLSVTILRNVSARVAGHALVELLVDSGASGEIMQGYMNRLLNVYDDTHDEDDEDDGAIGGSDHDAAVANAPNTTGSVKFQTPKKRRRRSSAASTSLPLATAGGSSVSSAHAIRATILDLLLENLSKPAPNVAHLLLGVLNGESTLHRSTGLLHSGLDVVLTLLGTAEFGTETPALAQRCHQIVYLLVSHESSSLTVVPVLEDSRYEFFSTQLNLFNDVYHLKRRRSVRDAIAELKMRGWFFKALAVYLHVALQREPPQMKTVNRLMAQLLLSGDRQQRMLLVRLLHESSFELAPPDVPSNPQAVALAEQATRAIDADGCLFKWLQIDVERFCEALQSSDLDTTANGSATASSFKRLRSDIHGGAVSTADALLQWAIQWNEYSERVAAESHALNSLRELIEVIVLDYLNVPASSDDLESGIAWQGLDAIASSEVRVELVNSVASAVLVKLTDRAHNAAPLVEVAAKLLLLLFSELRPSLGAMAASASHRQHSASYVDLLLRAVCHTAQATGNAVAAQNARTILYSCIVNVLSAMDDGGASNLGELCSATSTSDALLFALPSSLSASAANVLDLMCRDASEGGDVLSMALAVAGLEAMVVSNGVAVSKLLRERGYLLHFIALFRQLSEMDAALDQESRAAIDSAAAKHKSKAMALPHGVDASTIGTIYECFLSLFARVASTSEGAIALLEGGLVRAFAELRNLPSRRPRLVVPGGENGASGVHPSAPQAAALQRAEAVYGRKWLPIVRLVSALCATLPQNRTLAQQVLRLFASHRKLFTDCLKLAPHDRPSLSLLREVAHTTFVLRYVSQFGDLVAQEVTASKWEKITQNVLRIFLLYGSEVTPSAEDDDEQMTDDSSSVWWQRTVPSAASELRDDSVPRLRLSVALEDALLERGGADVLGLVRLSVFGEAKLYTARMIVCNAVAICSNRMLQSVDGGAQLLPGKNVLLAIAGTKKTTTSNAFKFPNSDAVDRRAFAASFDPLWSETPALSEFAVRLGVATNALDAATRVTKELGELPTGMRISEQDAEDLAKLQSLLEYQADSLTFVIENMTIVLLTHLTHYMNHNVDVTKGYVQQLLSQVLQTLSHVEGNAFVHALARRLRELTTK
ncbi:hypothetical protein ATCC90586_009409 [Pythium insidiosum]|nr:hypothetical protein ATCC90586_009409 [Pythium insidiosum]